MNKLLDLRIASNRFRGSAMITMRGAWNTEPLDKTNGLTHVCCVCKRVRHVDGSYKPRLIALDMRVTHGLCLRCVDTLRRGLK